MNIQRRTRANLKHEITIRGDHKEIIAGNTRNISLNGVYVETDEVLEIDEKCDVFIELHSVDPVISIHIKAHVVRVDGEGFAVTFDEMDVDSLHHLKQLVLYNTDNPEQFIEESRKKFGFK